MKVSVIVTAYNLEDYIEECIASIQKQTLKDIEIIIVNDGSTDKTGEIINKLGFQDRRLKIINKNNGGILAARGTGFKASRGDFILYIDGDDWIEENCCELLYEAATKYNSEMVICDFYEEYHNKTLHISSYSFGKIYAKEYLKSYFTGKLRSYVWIKMFRRDLLEGVDFSKKISLGDDCYLSILLFKHLNSVVKVDKYLIHYRIRKGSLTKKYDESTFDIWEIIKFLREDEYFSKVIASLDEEFQYFIYNHVFLGRVVEKLVLNKLHKKMFYFYSKEKIDIYNNRYYCDTTKAKHKILTRLYYLNYSIGNVTNKIIKLLIKRKNKLKFQHKSVIAKT